MEIEKVTSKHHYMTQVSWWSYYICCTRHRATFSFIRFNRRGTARKVK